METNLHSMANLFAQLGLPSAEHEVDAFIASHRPLDVHIELYAAPFWTPSQARFLREQIANDADWADVVDKLNTRLR